MSLIKREFQMKAAVKIPAGIKKPTNGGLEVMVVGTI